MVELFVDIFFDVLSQDLVLSFFLKFELVLDIPAGGKDSNIGRGHFFNSLCNHFVLKVEGLNRPWDKVVTSDQLLFILLVFLVFLSDLCFLFIVGD